MRHRTIHAAIAVCSLAVVLSIAVVDLGRTSPGPLTAVHQREDDLRGSSGCSECHGGFFSDMSHACLDCHEVIAQQIASSDGLHGAVGREQALKCALCHSEHNGPGFAIVNPQSYANAGSRGPDGFDHNLVGFAMEGAHLELDCVKCHANADAVVLGHGERRFIGLDQNCASCHEDVHKGQFVLACTSCHGQQTWEELHSLGHEKQLPLIGGHGDIACRECHAGSGAHSLESLGGFGVKPAARQCAQCHPSPHTQEFIARVGNSLAMAADASCVTCHEAAHTSFREEGLTVTPAQHALSGFALELPHDKAGCVDCHAAELETFVERYPGRGADTCSACHEDPHAGQFAEGPFSKGECTACHERERFEPHAFTLEKHALASLSLTGAHAETDCNDCHVDPAPDTPRVFHGTPSDCAGCHADAHQGFFDAIATKLPPMEHGDCARCHGTSTFAQLDAFFDHAQWTGFPVLGAHAESDCASCHPTAHQPDDTGRTFGRVAEHFGKFEGCASCHEDVHEGDFDRKGLPKRVEGRSDCARCHAESSFRALPHGYDHRLWTGFAVVGAHEAAGCAACHAPMRRADEVGRTWQRASGPLCADCHVDPHAGQFDVDGATDCESCHTSEVESLSTFRHDSDSRFSLGDAHSRLECSACHMPFEQDGALVVRYRPLGRKCSDCHGVQEEALLIRKSRKK